MDRLRYIDPQRRFAKLLSDSAQDWRKRLDYLCFPEYLAERGMPATPEELMGHSCFNFGFNSPWNK